MTGCQSLSFSSVYCTIETKKMCVLMFVLAYMWNGIFSLGGLLGPSDTLGGNVHGILLQNEPMFTLN